jgi:hypothetical protein
MPFKFQLTWHTSWSPQSIVVIGLHKSELSPDFLEFDEPLLCHGYGRVSGWFACQTNYARIIFNIGYIDCHEYYQGKWSRTFQCQISILSGPVRGTSLITSNFPFKNVLSLLSSELKISSGKLQKCVGGRDSAPNPLEGAHSTLCVLL